MDKLDLKQSRRIFGLNVERQKVKDAEEAKLMT